MRSPGNVELAGIGVVSFLLMAAVVALLSPPGGGTPAGSEGSASSGASIGAAAADVLSATLDCRDREAFAHFDLDAGRPVTEAEPWDVECRRHVLLSRAGRLPKWYRYQMAAHRLDPRGDEYELTSSEGAVFGVTPVSYYCGDGEGGCLAIRYRRLDATDPAPSSPPPGPSPAPAPSTPAALTGDGGTAPPLASTPAPGQG